MNLLEVMTLKFLNDAPKEPPKTAFAIFVGEKRLAVVETHGDGWSSMFLGVHFPLCFEPV